MDPREEASAAAESKADCEALDTAITSTEPAQEGKWPMLICRLSLNVLLFTSLTAFIDAVYLLVASSETAVTPQVLFVISSVASLVFILLFCLSTRTRSVDCCGRPKSTLNHLCVLLAPGLIALWALSMGLDTGSNFSSTGQEAGLLILELVIGVVAFLASVCLMLIVAFVKDCFCSTLLTISKKSTPRPTIENEKPPASIVSRVSTTSRPRSCLKTGAKSSSTTLGTESVFSQCSTVTNTPVLPAAQHVYRTVPSTTRRPISFTSILSSNPTTKPSFLSTVEETPLELNHKPSWDPEDLFPAPLRPRKDLKRDVSPNPSKSKHRVKRKSLKRPEPSLSHQSSSNSTKALDKSYRSASTATASTKVGDYESSQSSICSDRGHFSLDKRVPASSFAVPPAQSELTSLLEEIIATPSKPRRPHIARSAPSYPPPSSAVPPVPKIPEDLTSASDQNDQSSVDMYREHRRKRKRGERRARQALVVSGGEVVLTQGAAPKIVKVRRVPEPSLSPSAKRMSAMLEARLAASGQDPAGHADFEADGQFGASQWLAGPRMARSRTATTIMREAEEICRVFDADRMAHVRKSWASGRGLLLSLGRRKGEVSKQDLIM